MYVLRDYQQDAKTMIRTSLKKGFKRPLYVLSTGGGKSAIICSIIADGESKGSQCLFLAPRRQLVYQISEDLDANKVQHGVLMAGEPFSFSPSVTVASLDTFYSRMDRIHKKYNLIIVDEAHVFGTKLKAILEKYPEAIVIGCTATPARSDGRGLGEIYDDMILGISMSELIERGFLVPCRYFTTPKKINLEGVKITAGDYNQKQLDERMNDPVLVGDIVDNWKRIAPDRQTVVFAVKRSHALSIQKRFLESGIVCDYIDGDTDNEERKRILKRIETGESQVISSVDVLSYGWNSPVVSCAIMARPTKSVARYLQAVGRVLRSSPGKEDAILIDHANVVHELGFVEDDQPWTLDGSTKIQDVKEKKQQEQKEPASMTCPHCQYVQKPSPTCSNCKADIRKKYEKEIQEFQADLAEIDRKTKKAEQRKWSKEDKQLFYSELVHVAFEKGYKDGWISHKYKERTGVWPKDLKKNPVQPSLETRRWLKSRRIAFAKAREKEKQNA